MTTWVNSCSSTSATKPKTSHTMSAGHANLHDGWNALTTCAGTLVASDLRHNAGAGALVGQAECIGRPCHETRSLTFRVFPMAEPTRHFWSRGRVLGVRADRWICYSFSAYSPIAQL